jgi:SAM-dependent methyltransferase
VGFIGRVIEISLEIDPERFHCGLQDGREGDVGRHNGRMSTNARFEQLLAEGLAAPTEGWDFSWFDGRATEGRPSWKYSRAMRDRMAKSHAILDIQTGGGERLAEVLSEIDAGSRLIFATESWGPNIPIAQHNLERYQASIVEAADDSDLPFLDRTFDLVTSRHPTITLWKEIARVLQPGGTYFSQQVGAGTNSELTDFMMGSQPKSEVRSTQRAVDRATSVGLDVIDLREESLTIQFFDVGAIVYFLRKVIWTVPNFSVEVYRGRLLEMHEHIERFGSFQSHSQRFLIEAMKPTPQ